MESYTKMKTKTYIILIVILVIVSLLILIKNYNENIVGEGKIDTIELYKEDMKECCKYIDEDGKEKTCSVLLKYSCDLCASRCS